MNEYAIMHDIKSRSYCSIPKMPNAIKHFETFALFHSSKILTSKKIIKSHYIKPLIFTNETKSTRVVIKKCLKCVLRAAFLYHCALTLQYEGSSIDFRRDKFMHFRQVKLYFFSFQWGHYTYIEASSLWDIHHIF